MDIVLKRPDGSIFLAISYVADNNYIFMDWKGYLEVEMVKQGSEELLKMLNKTKAQKVLISNKNITGPWIKANEWYATDWNPRAKQAGLKYMSVIVSDNIFTALSLKGFEKINNGHYLVFSHNDEEVAKKWLLEQP